MKLILGAFLFVFLFVSCEDAKKDMNKISSEKKISIESEVDSDSFNIDLNSIYPVFKISDDMHAIVLELNLVGEESLFYNQIFQKLTSSDTLAMFDSTRIRPVNSVIIDTSGFFNILKNKSLEKGIKGNLNNKYYLYGTKGYTEIKLKNVFFSMNDECLSQIIAVELDQFDSVKIGKPMFCSEELLDLEYKLFSEKTKSINEFHNSLPWDYFNPKNSIKVYGKSKQYFFTYEDDFNWYKSGSDSKIDFPSRAIYKIGKNNKIDKIWMKSLDLFGIPCD